MENQTKNNKQKNEEKTHTYWIVETTAKTINNNTPVHLTPYNTKTRQWQYNNIKTTTIKEALKQNNITCKTTNQELKEYIQKNAKRW